MEEKNALDGKITKNKKDEFAAFMRKYETLQRRRKTNERRSLIRQFVYSAKFINSVSKQLIDSPSLINVPVLISDIFHSDESEVKYGLEFYKKVMESGDNAVIQGLQFREFDSRVWVRFLFDEKKSSVIDKAGIANKSE